MNEPLKVAINAQLRMNSGGGGAESVLIGLLSALGRLHDGDEQFIVIGHHSDPNWLRRYLGPNQTIRVGPPPAIGAHTVAERAKRALGPLRPLVRRIWRTVVPAGVV